MTRSEHIRKNPGGGIVSSKLSVRRLVAAILVICMVLLLINVGIPALNEKWVYDKTNLNSYLVEGHEPRTVTDSNADWLAFTAYRKLPVGNYAVSVRYSTDTNNNYVEVLSEYGESIYKEQLNAKKTVHKFRVSINDDEVSNFHLRIWYAGEGTLTVDKEVVRSVRKDLLAAQYTLDVAVLFAVLGYCASKFRKAVGEVEPLPWKKRVKKALPVALLLSVTFCVAGPIGLYVTNTNEFWFSLGQMMPMVIICFMAVTVVGTVLLSLVPKKMFYWVLAVVFGLGVALYFEGNFLIRNLGLLNGSDVNWDQYSTWAVIDTLIVLVIVLIPVLVMYFRRGFAKKLIAFGSLFLVFTQLLATGMSVATTDGLDGFGNSLLTTAHMTELSKEDNIFIVLADTLDAGFIRTLLEDEPEYAGRLKDFIWYRNAASSGFYTGASVPAIFTDVVWTDTIEWNKRLKLGDQYTPLYKALADNGYDIGMYTDTGLVLPDQYMSNAYEGRPFIASQTRFTSTWMKLTAFRYFPQIFKGVIHVEFTEFNENEAGKDGAEIYLYDVNNTVGYLHRPLTADNEKKTFHFIHFPGSHGGHNLNEYGIIDTTETNEDQRARGCLKILFNYIDQMKDLGIYDNSTIIFMADHGIQREEYSPFNPTFLIKPKGHSGAFSISDAPISYEDLLPTLLEMIGEDGSRYGRTIFEIGEDEQRERVCWAWNNGEADGVWRSMKYTGTAPAWDFGAWTMEGTPKYAQVEPVHVAEITESIEDVEQYNTITVKNINEVRCDFAGAPVGDVQVNMTLYTLIEDSSHLVVTANGTEVFNDTFVSGERSFTIPDELVDDSVTLQFTFPEATDSSAYLIAYDFAGTEMGE